MKRHKNSLIQELEDDPRWLVSLSRRLLGTHEGAEDLAQDAAALALGYDGRSGSMDRGHARAWLATTVKHLASNARRRRSTESYARRALESDSDAGALPAREPLPADVLAKAEYRSRVAALVLELPEAERQAILLRYYEGKRGDELQEALGAPSEAAVRQRISRGIAKLREQLEADRAANDWRHAAFLTMSGAVTAPTPGKLAVVAAALVILGGAVGGAWWMSSTDSESEERPGLVTAGLETVPMDVVEAPSAIRSASASTEETRQSLSSASTAVQGRASREFRVQLLDEASGEPLAGQAWFMIATGKLDSTRKGGLAGDVPNPKPLSSGVSDDQGFVLAPFPEYELVNLCTDRTETHARGSWPIRIRDGVAAPDRVSLKVGSTIEGRVLDEEGAPLEGAQVFSRSYFDERISLGATRADGFYSIPRCADFPRRFLRREDGEIGPDRILPTELAFARPGAPSDAPFIRYSEGQLDVLVEEAQTATAPDVILPSLVSVAGRVLDSRGRGIVGALVTSAQADRFVATGKGKRDVPSALVWTDHDFTLGQQQCLTQAGGRYAMKLRAPTRGRTTAYLAAYSPGGDLGFLSVSDATPGASRGNLDFEMRDAEAVRLRIVLPDGVQKLDPNIQSVRLVWDLRVTSAQSDAGPGSSATISPSGTPVVEAYPDGWCVQVPRFHQPDRTVASGRLSGTVFVPGFLPQRFELAPGVNEADLPLRVPQRVKLRLEVEGEGASWLERASAVVTSEAPDRAQSPEALYKRYRSNRPFRTRVSGWENGGERSVRVFGDQPVHVYVNLFGSGDREPRALPAFGPFTVIDAGSEDEVFVMKASLDDWPETPPEAADTLGSKLPSDLNQRRPSIIKARVVSDVDGSFLVTAQGRVARGSRGNFFNQRIVKGEERAVNLRVFTDSATLRFEHFGHYPKEIGPISVAPGATVDLGDIRLEPLRRIPCRMERPEGSSAGGGYIVTRRDPDIGWAKMTVDSEGRFDLFIQRSASLPLRIEYRKRGNPTKYEATVELLPDGSGRVIVPELRTVQIRVTGLEAPYCYGLQSVRAEHTTAADGAKPTRSRCHLQQLDGTDIIFSCQLQPGSWTFLSESPAFATLPPIPFEVEPAASGESEEEGPLQLTIRAALALR